MTRYRADPDPPLTLADRLRRLNDSLQALAIRLKDAIASAISRSVMEAVRDAIRALLGVEQEQVPKQYPFRSDLQHQPDPYQYPDEDLWQEEVELTEEVVPSSSAPRQHRWQEAVRAGLQTGLWWLRRQPGKRPVLTAALLALAAGGAVLAAGPTLAACVGVAASIASLILTADNVSSVYCNLGVAV